MVYYLRGTRRARDVHAAQIRSIKRQINLNKGEIKKAYFNANALSVANSSVQVIDLTGIVQGVEDDQRIGRRIRVLSVDLRISIAARNLDAYLIQGYKNTTPSFTDFDSSYAAHLDQDARFEFRELKYLKELRSLTSYVFYTKRWKTGLPVHYDGPTATDGCRNCLFLVFKNSSGAVVSGNHYSVVVSYRD